MLLRYLRLLHTPPPAALLLLRALSSRAAAAPSASSAAAALLPPPSFLYTDLRDNDGARTRKRRKGRGPGSGHGLGRSAGLGTRGQNSHGGGLAITFEGGQSPLWRRTPKFGQMHKMFRQELEALNLDRLQLWIDTGRLDATQCVGCGGAAGWRRQGPLLPSLAALPRLSPRRPPSPPPHRSLPPRPPCAGPSRCARCCRAAA